MDSIKIVKITIRLGVVLSSLIRYKLWYVVDTFANEKVEKKEKKIIKIEEEEKAFASRTPLLNHRYCLNCYLLFLLFSYGEIKWCSWK